MKTNQKVFQIIDLDRTLLDTAKLAHHLKDIIARHDEALSDDISQEIVLHFNNKTSFFIFEYILGRIGEVRFGEYMDELHVLAPSLELYLPGALERMAYAKSQPGWAMGIMTYGSKRDQMIKLKLLNLQFEHVLITNTPYKGELIASWKQKNGTFKLPIEFGGHTVGTVTLDDDKRIAFEHLPEGAFGQWISRAALGGMNELPYVPDNIRVLPNLLASIEYLKTKLR